MHSTGPRPSGSLWKQASCRRVSSPEVKKVRKEARASPETLCNTWVRVVCAV